MDRYCEKERSGCAIVGIMNENGKRFNGEQIIQSIAVMHERSNGLGGGFAAYGIYPEYRELYAFHLLYDNEKAKEVTEKHLDKNFQTQKDEPIPHRKMKVLKNIPCLWRYFLNVKDEKKRKKI